jgi:hypothetical protein
MAIAIAIAVPFPTTSLQKYIYPIRLAAPSLECSHSHPFRERFHSVFGLRTGERGGFSSLCASECIQVLLGEFECVRSFFVGSDLEVSGFVVGLRDGVRGWLQSSAS